MALTEQVILDIQSAQRQIDQLERQLAQLATPINVPVDVDASGDINRVTSELRQADTSVENLNRELAQTDDALRQAGTAARRTGDDIESVGRRGGSAFGALNTAVGKLGLAFGAAAAGSAFLRFAGDAIEAASDLEESVSKSTVVFGTFNDEIQEFASTAPQALGLSTQAAIEFSATFGNLFVALGLSQQAAAELSPEIVQLGADLASFNNIDVTEALDKLRAGLVGEAEPLRVLGVNLTAAATAAKAVELGLAASTGEVSEAAKVQARYALILEQTQTAQGDFARTAEGLANTQRSLTAEWENAQATIGQALVPALQAAIPIVSDLARAAGEMGIRLGIALGNIDAAAGRLQILALQSGQAADSATVLFGAVRELENEFLSGAAGTDEFNRSAEDLEDTIISLVDSWGGSSGETQTLLDNLDRLAVEFGLTEEAAASLREELEQRRATAFAEQEDIGLLNNLARAVGEVKTEFEGTGPLLSGFGEDLEGIADVDVGVQSVISQLEGLPTALDTVRVALRDDENAIVDDFGTFLTNLETEIAAQQAFTENLGILQALGLDDLAESFAAAGLEAAGALADAVANPEEARRAEQLLEGQARAQAAAFNQAFIAALDPDLSVDVRANLIIDTLGLAGQIRDAGEILIGGRVAPTGPGGAGPGGTQIIQNFYETPTPNTETERAGQAINSIISGGGLR